MGFSSETNTTVYFIICDGCGSKGPLTLDILEMEELTLQSGFHYDEGAWDEIGAWRCPACLEREVSERKEKVGRLLKRASYAAYPEHRKGRMEEIRERIYEAQSAWEAYLRLIEGE